MHVDTMQIFKNKILQYLKTQICLTPLVSHKYLLYFSSLRGKSKVFFLKKNLSN